MAKRFDKKGKVFTEKVTKDRVRVVIQTNAQRIKGHVHVRPDQRLRDDLNQSPDFVAVTNGSVLNGAGEEALRFDFLAINREQIVWVLEDEDREPADTPGGKL